MKLFLALILLVPLFSEARGTDISGGGGNSVKAEFISITRDALTTLVNRSDTKKITQNFDGNRALIIFKKTGIDISDSPLLLDGQNVSAINYPSQNKIVLYKDDWTKMNRLSKIQLAIHEIIGLSHRNILDDQDYSISKILAESVLRTGLEDVALAMAKANFYQALEPQVQTQRTIFIGKFPDENGEQGEISRIFVQTFENSSKKSVRIYDIYTDYTGAVVKVLLSGFEGPVGG